MVLGDTIHLSNDPLKEQRQHIAPLMQEYISPVFSDFLDKAPWYAGIALCVFIALFLLMIWIAIRFRNGMKKKNKQPIKTLSTNVSKSSY